MTKKINKNNEINQKKDLSCLLLGRNNNHLFVSNDKKNINIKLKEKLFIFYIEKNEVFFKKFDYKKVEKSIKSNKFDLPVDSLPLFGVFMKVIPSHESLGQASLAQQQINSKFRNSKAGNQAVMEEESFTDAIMQSIRGVANDFLKSLPDPEQSTEHRISVDQAALVAQVKQTLLLQTSQSDQEKFSSSIKNVQACSLGERMDEINQGKDAQYKQNEEKPTNSFANDLTSDKTTITHNGTAAYPSLADKGKGKTDVQVNTEETHAKAKDPTNTMSSSLDSKVELTTTAELEQNPAAVQLLKTEINPNLVSAEKQECLVGEKLVNTLPSEIDQKLAQLQAHGKNMSGSDPLTQAKKDSINKIVLAKNNFVSFFTDIKVNIPARIEQLKQFHQLIENEENTLATHRPKPGLGWLYNAIINPFFKAIGVKNVTSAKLVSDMKQELKYSLDAFSKLCDEECASDEKIDPNHFTRMLGQK